MDKKKKIKAWNKNELKKKKKQRAIIKGLQ